ATLHHDYPRLTHPPLNLQTDELLSAVAERLKVLREARPRTVRSSSSSSSALLFRDDAYLDHESWVRLGREPMSFQVTVHPRRRCGRCRVATSTRSPPAEP